MKTPPNGVQELNLPFLNKNFSLKQSCCKTIWAFLVLKHVNTGPTCTMFFAESHTSPCFSIGNLQDGSNETPRRPGMQPENVSKSEKWPKEQDLKTFGVPASSTANLNLNAFESTFPTFLTLITGFFSVKKQVIKLERSESWFSEAEKSIHQNSIAWPNLANRSKNLGDFGLGKAGGLAPLWFLQSWCFFCFLGTLQKKNVVWDDPASQKKVEHEDWKKRGFPRQRVRRQILVWHIGRIENHPIAKVFQPKYG